MANEHDYLMHHGIRGQRWGIRRYQNEDGTLTAEGREHYLSGNEQKKFANKMASSTKISHLSYNRRYKKATNIPQIVDGAKHVKTLYEESKKLHAEADKMREDFGQFSNPEYEKYAKKFAQEWADSRKKIGIDYPVEKVLKDLRNGELDDGSTPWHMYLNDHPEIKTKFHKLYSDSTDLQKRAYDEAERIASEFLGVYANRTASAGKFDEDSIDTLKERAADWITEAARSWN